MNRSQRLDNDLLNDIAVACDAAGSFVAGVSEPAFLASDLLQSAVWAKITIIGEAASKLSRGLRSATAEVPWQDIIGMRNRMVHDYMSVDWPLVWRTVQNDLPALKQHIARVQNMLK